MDGCMDGWMDGWMHGCMDAWMHGCMDAWMHGCMDAWMHGCMDAWMHGCMDAWMHGCMDAWMDRWMDGGMEGAKEGRRDGGMEGGTEGWREGGRDGRMDGTARMVLPPSQGASASVIGSPPAKVRGPMHVCMRSPVPAHLPKRTGETAVIPREVSTEACSESTHPPVSPHSIGKGQELTANAERDGERAP